MRSGLESTSNRNYGAWVQSRNWVQHALARPLLSDARHADGVQHRQHASAVGDPHARPRGRARGSSPTRRWPAAGIHARALAAGSAGHLLRRQRHADDAAADARVRRAVSRSRAASSDAGRSCREPWIERSFVPRGRSPISDQEYGYGWWMRELGGHRAYYAWGFGGQYIFVVPDLDLVVVTTSSSTVAEDRRSHRRNVFDLVEYLIVEPVASSN